MRERNRRFPSWRLKKYRRIDLRHSVEQTVRFRNIQSVVDGNIETYRRARPLVKDDAGTGIENEAARRPKITRSAVKKNKWCIRAPRNPAPLKRDVARIIRREHHVVPLEISTNLVEKPGIHIRKAGAVTAFTAEA